ncbi:LysR family transcriptional regulator [Pseudorhodoplanes sp.]|uniref:LysR family transcriptional regulator n=1 Tax=Pseudorhodoplanes sp. TaxID=1934341 RepID=UPI002BC0EB7D|nr:LysR family transcriptional regulator [Pseudorhodoplanes sp.]HWV55649.1 LysR family transcriptional regulator [Pseudorhodoplanes sp.]
MTVNNTMDRFRTMETFVRVARSGSFTVAAKQLGLSRALVSRHVGALEDRLGVPLLHRTTRSLDLTDEGRSYLTFCEQMFRDIEGQERALVETPAEPSGTLRLAAPKSFGALHLSDAIIAFARAQPKLHVQVILENVSFRPTDFGKRGFDVVLQFAPARNASLTETPIAPMDWLVCAAPSVLIREGRPGVPADLARFPCLLHESALPNDRLWRFEGPRGPVTVKVTGTFSSNSALALRKAAIAGLGAALLPRYVVADDLASGNLVPLFSRYRVAARPLIAVYPRSPETPLKVKAFVSFLTEWIASRGGNLTSAAAR